jgi:hypothetical protein
MVNEEGIILLITNYIITGVRSKWASVYYVGLVNLYITG